MYGIKSRREALGWSRAYLAHESGTVEQTIANLEQKPRTGRRPSSLSAVRAALDRGEAQSLGTGDDGTVEVRLDPDGSLIVRGPRPRDVAATVEELRRLRDRDRDSSERPT